jgi:DNA-binding protein Fis
MKTRITADLGDPRLLRLIKTEAHQTGSTMRDVLVQALESYFADRLETKALEKISEQIFTEWNDPLDHDYDKL